MAQIADWKRTDGRQQAVIFMQGATVFAKDQIVPFNVMLIQSGTAVIDVFSGDDNLHSDHPRIPILMVPAGATVLKVVATCSLASISDEEKADIATWAVNEVGSEEDPNSGQLFIVPQVFFGGFGAGFGRIAYHVTVLLFGPDLVGGIGLQALVGQDP